MTTNDKRQHNLQLPISCIPNEILSEVFCNLRNVYLWTQPRHGRSRSYGLKYWITVSHVCHAWREVALDTSVLWCYIDFLFNKPETQVGIPELLRRSKQSPLRLKIGGTLPEDSILDQVKLHFGRVRDLVLSDPNEDTLQEVCLSKFQNLEALEISTPYPGNLEGFILNDSHVRSGCLRSLNLSCSIDWKSKFLQGLTRLQVFAIPNVCRLGCHEFLLVLSKIPRLETLDLLGFIKEDNIFIPVKVHLVHLQKLSVRCPVRKMSQFLPCLVIPRSCRLRLGIGITYDEICPNFRAILLWLSNRFRVPTTASSTESNASEQYIQSFQLLHDSDRVDFTIRGFSNVLSHEQMESAAADPILELVFHWAYDDDNFSSNLTTFLSFFPFQGLVSLGVVSNYGVYLSPELWTVVFGSIRTLKEIYLKTKTSTFWEALARTNGDEESVVVVVVDNFPALKSITVDDYFLESQPILDALRVRSELGDGGTGGTRLQSLVFINRVPPEWMVRRLGELVSCVRVVRGDTTDRMPRVPGEDSDS